MKLKRQMSVSVKAMVKGPVLSGQVLFYIKDYLEFYGERI